MHQARTAATAHDLAPHAPSNVTLLATKSSLSIRAAKPTNPSQVKPTYRSEASLGSKPINQQQQRGEDSGSKVPEHVRSLSRGAIRLSSRCAAPPTTPPRTPHSSLHHPFRHLHNIAERLASVFVIKERFLKNSRRVWTFHPSTYAPSDNTNQPTLTHTHTYSPSHYPSPPHRLISVEGDAEKMNIAYSALQSITPGRVPSQFSIKTANFTDTYYADPHRPRVLTLLYLFSQWSSHLHDLNPLSVRVVQTKWRTGEVCRTPHTKLGYLER